MPDIKIKRYADKENLKKLMKYSKDTFANKSEINEKFYTKEQIDTMLESGSGGTGGGGGTVDLTNYYTKTEVDNLLDNIGGGTGGDYYTKSEIDTKLNSKANTSDLSTVATSGDYNDLINKPNISKPNAVLQSWPDGPEAHNAMWGGRNITAAFDAGTVSDNIRNGTFRDIFPGDYIMKQVTIPQVLADDGTTVIYAGGTHTIAWVIVDCDYWGHTNVTAHHVAIVPAGHIFYTRMNPTNTTEGGYAGSEMFKKIIPACATGIVNAFGSNHILTFRDAITNSVDTSHASSGLPQFMGTPGWFGEWVSVQCNLMSEKMVYGAPIYSGGAMDNTMVTRQMSAFRLSSSLLNDNIWGRAWWLRDVVSSSLFAAVSNYTDASGSFPDAWGNGVYARANSASDDHGGVRPFALLR